VGKGCLRYSELISSGCRYETWPSSVALRQALVRSNQVSRRFANLCYIRDAFPYPRLLVSLSCPASSSPSLLSCSPLPRWIRDTNITRRWTTLPSRGLWGPLTSLTSYKVMLRPLAWSTMSPEWLTTRPSDASAGDSISGYYQSWRLCVGSRKHLDAHPFWKIMGDSAELKLISDRSFQCPRQGESRQCENGPYD
jgi:hypothetical protein